MNKRKRSKSKPTGEKAQQEQKLSALPFTPDSREDLQLADEIAKSTSLTEVDFDRWQSCHSDLDLQIPVWIKPEDLLQENLAKTIHFSRTVKGTSAKESARERDTFTFQIPTEVKDGTRIVAPAKGDKKGEFCGDLIIILKVKH